MTRRGVLLLALLPLLLAGCDGREVYEGKLVLGGTHAFERVEGDLVLLTGRVSVPAGAQVSGSIYVLSGSLALDGRVAGDVISLGGDVTLGASAVVAGDLSAGGGAFERADGARVLGKAEPGLALPDLSGREAPPLEQLIRFLIELLLVAGLAWAGARWLPHPTARLRDALRRHALAAAALGALSGLVGIVLLVFMAFTLVLIPVTVAGLLLGGAMVVGGWVGFGALLGAWIAQRVKRSWRAPAAAFWGTLAFMALLNGVERLPLLGGLAALLLTATGLGAVLLTRFGSRAFVPPALDVADD